LSRTVTVERRRRLRLDDASVEPGAFDRTFIRIADLEFRYGEDGFRLSVPGFTVDRAEKVAVIGPSGSGKTTLLNLIAGIVTPLTGSVSVDGVEISGLDDEARRRFRLTEVGIVFQDLGLLDYLNLFDNIVHAYRLARALKVDKGVRARAEALAQGMDIGDQLERFPHELSHGERQQVAVCRALVHRPRLVLADQATGCLHPTEKDRMLSLLFRSAEVYEATVVAVIHDHDLLSRFDRVVEMQDLGAWENTRA